MPDNRRKQLEAAMRQLRSQRWFTDGWTLRLSEPDDGGVGWVGIQLAKKHWFNEDGRGIHFETWMGDKELRGGKLPFVMHVLHQPTFPGTNKTAAQFMRLWHTMPEPREIIAEWPGYKAGRAKPLAGGRRFTDDDAAAVIVGEFSRLQVLGLYVDQALAHLLAIES